MCENFTGKMINWSYSETNGIVDHIWWISGLRKVIKHYQNWKYEYGIQKIRENIFNSMLGRDYVH
jgi:CDP-paratose 2-epimerase